MHWQNLPDVLPLPLLVIMSLVLAWLAWRHRPARAAVLITILMLAEAEFSLAYMLELLSSDLGAKLFFARAQFVGFLILPTVWLAFVLEYTGQERWLSRRNMALALLVPAITLLVLWTNDLHHWFIRTSVLRTTGPTPALALTYGPFFWVQSAYIYLLVLAGCGLIFEQFLHTQRLYRMQIITLLVGVLLPWTGQAIYLSGLNPFPGLRPAYLVFVLSGVAIVSGLFRYRLLDIKPVARAALIEGMDDGVIVLDAQDRVVDLNAAAQRIFDQPAGRAVGQPASSALAGWPVLPDSPSGENVTHTDLELCREGTPRYYDLRVSRLWGPQGDLSGRLFVLRDITERRAAERAEQEQRALANALRDATASLANIIEFGGVLDRILLAAGSILPYDCGNVMLIDGDLGRVVRTRDGDACNRAESTLGLTLAISGTANLRCMLETGQPLAIPDTGRYSGWVPLEQTAWIASHVGAPIRSQGQIMGFLGLDSATPGFYTQDHAERLQVLADGVAIALENSQLYTSLREANAGLRTALQARDEMIQNVSHELRQPLTVLLGHLELLDEGALGPLSAPQEQSVIVARAQGLHLQEMFERLLTLQSFKPEHLEREPLAVGSWLAQLMSLWQVRAQRDGLRLRLEAREPLPLVLADRQFLGQVLGNLLDNAFKFSPQGGEILLRACSQGDEVVISVCDEGIGIALDQQGRIFERFHQVDGSKTRRYGGMGIGLALCQTIVAAHGGRIWVESPGEGCGSAFHVALKAEAAAEPAE